MQLKVYGNDEDAGRKKVLAKRFNIQAAEYVFNVGMYGWGLSRLTEAVEASDRNIVQSPALYTSGASGCTIIAIQASNGTGALAHWASSGGPGGASEHVRRMITTLGARLDAIVFAAGAEVGDYQTELLEKTKGMVASGVTVQWGDGKLEADSTESYVSTMKEVLSHNPTLFEEWEKKFRASQEKATPTLKPRAYGSCFFLPLTFELAL